MGRRLPRVLRLGRPVVDVASRAADAVVARAAAEMSVQRHRVGAKTTDSPVDCLKNTNFSAFTGYNRRLATNPIIGSVAWQWSGGSVEGLRFSSPDNPSGGPRAWHPNQRSADPIMLESTCLQVV